MTFAEFHNGLRILMSIDSHELGDPAWWPEFRDNPHKFLITCNAAAAEQIWVVMLKRGAVK